MSAAAIPAISYGLQAMGDIMAGDAAEEQAALSARMSRRNAAIARDQAAAEAVRQHRVSRKVIGSMRAAYGASGVTTEGSPLEVLQESARMAENDRQTILYRGELRAVGAETEAYLFELEGDAAQDASRISAAGRLVFGAGEIDW